MTNKFDKLFEKLKSGNTLYIPVSEEVEMSIKKSGGFRSGYYVNKIHKGVEIDGNLLDHSELIDLLVKYEVIRYSDTSTTCNVIPVNFNPKGAA